MLRLGQSVYFILMCLKPMDNGTVSVVVIGFGPAESGVIDFEFPISSTLPLRRMTKNGQPLDEGTLPVKVEKLNGNGSSSVCGLLEDTGNGCSCFGWC